MKIAPLIGFPGRILNGSTIKENLTDPSIQVKTLLDIESAFDPDIIYYIMDLSVESDSLGLKLDFTDDKSPTVIEHPIITEKDLDRLCYDNILEKRLKVFLDVTKDFKKRSKKPLGAYVVGPYTLSGLLMGAKGVAMSIIAKKELLNKVLVFSTELIERYSTALKANGADYIIILEPTSVILSPVQFNTFSASYIERIAANIGDNCILHVCGNTTHLFEEMGKLKNIMGLSLDSVIDLRTAYEKTKKIVIGNISPVTVCHGTKDEISKAVYDLLHHMSGINDFILSTGCDLPPETPIENIRHFIDCARKYSE